MRGAPVRAGFVFPIRSIFDDSAYVTNKMAASYNWPSSVMAIKINKCDHVETKNMMVSIKNTKLIVEIFNDHHIVEDGDAFEKSYSLKCECKTELNLAMQSYFYLLVRIDI